MRTGIPSATYRLQLHKGFTLADAAAKVPYFRSLGISHLYLLPILVARAGSMHGYDVIDHRRVNPELGGEPALLGLADTCHTAGIGLIADIVPNHMAVGGADNPLWLDVLENGRQSAFASLFDIDFDTPDPALAGKILAPVLGQPYGEVLAEGGLSLVWDADLEKLAIAYGPHRLPIRPEDYLAVTAGQPAAQTDLAPWRDPERLHALLERQHFRLAWWRSAGDEINWRRFFDVNDLAGLRMEDEAVFEYVHAVIFRLYGEGVIDGVRVDHVDGLADPAAYARRLRDRLAGLNDHRPPGAPRDGPWIVVEKILGGEEALPPAWPVDGTSGYDFMDEVSALQHEPAGEAALDQLWTELSGRPADFDIEETAARGEIVQTAFAGQLMACSRALERLAREDPAGRDLTVEGFRRALIALITRLRVYRSYAVGAPSPLDPAIARAIGAAREAAPAERPCLDFLSRVLTGAAPGSAQARAGAVRRLNQLTAPVAAKAVEDTAFYRYSRLLSRTDVGFDPRRLGLSNTGFLARGRRRARERPLAMLTTATHDHKRGEDVRARLAVLSELPLEWREAVTGWLEITAGDRPPAIAVDDAYALFQTLVGAWPTTLSPDDTEGLAAFGDRLAGWREKSLREAKLRSSWVNPDMAYEALNQDWLRRLLDPRRSGPFLHSLTRFVARITGPGAINGVVQAALRCVWPGVPDLYQGAEFWDLSLVDPDNRRPVDYAARQAALSRGDRDWRTGAVKQATIARLLAARRADPHLFTIGALEALETRGRRAGCVLAFERRLEGRTAQVAVMLRVAGPVTRAGDLPSAEWWGDTSVALAGGWRPAAGLFTDGPVFLAMGDAGQATERPAQPLNEFDRSPPGPRQ